MTPLTNGMLTNWLGRIFRSKAAIPLVLLSLGSSAFAQEVSVALLRPKSMSLAPAPFMSTTSRTVTSPERPVHRFWDRENSALFAANAAFGTADFFVTRANLRNGGQELNPITRLFTGSTTALAVNFAGQSAGVIGLSYFFHKTGHHRLERAVSLVNIGSSAAAVSFGLAHR
jgi:hypothetical protein